MPNMPFFTLQAPLLPANGSNSNSPASPASLQNNTQTQALSPAGQLDGSGTGGDAAPSFSQTLNAQLQVPLLPVGQEFAAVLPPVGALQSELNQQQNNDDSSLVAGAWSALQPLLNEPAASAPLDLQDIRRQRALSEKLMTQATPIDGSQPQAVDPNTVSGPQLMDTQHTEGALANQINQPLPLTPTASANEAGQQPEPKMAQAANAVPAFAQKTKAVAGALTEDGKALNESLHSELDGELAMKNLHEKPLTLTPKTTLQGETFTPPPQAVLTESAPAPSSELLMQGSSGLLKEQAGVGPLIEKSQLQNTAPGPSSFKLDVPPSHPQWSDQIAKRIGIMSNENMQSARIQLDPPELGALEVKIKIQNDHMTVAFTSGNQQVREALEAQSPRLREMLEQQGINLTDVNVSDQSSQQAAAGQEQGEFAEEGPLSAVEADLENEEQMSVELQSDSLVDYFA